MKQVRIQGVCAKCAQACPQKYDSTRKFSASMFIVCDDESMKTEFVGTFASDSLNENKDTGTQSNSISLLIEEKAIVNLKILDNKVDLIKDADIVMYCYEIGNDIAIQSIIEKWHPLVVEKKQDAVKVAVGIKTKEISDVNESSIKIKEAIKPNIVINASINSKEEIRAAITKAAYSYLEEKRPYWKESSEDSGCIIA